MVRLQVVEAKVEVVKARVVMGSQAVVADWASLVRVGTGSGRLSCSQEVCAPVGSRVGCVGKR